MEANTKQFRKRNAILSCIQETDCHPSAETVHAMLQKEHPDISLATVYRNLALFKRQGLITSLGTVNGVERFDANTHPHVHFICNGCDAVTDLMQIHVPEELNQQVNKATGGEVTMCHLTFNGYCRDCQTKCNTETA
jgi:Fur family peroxide stress response transcriptional regulator